MSQAPASVEPHSGVSALLDRMSSGPSLIRSGAFHELLSQLWGEDPEQPGRGLVRVPGPETAGARAALIDATVGDDPELAAATALILALVTEAECDHGTESPEVSIALGQLLDRLDGAVGSKPPEQDLTESLLFLLGHFPDQAETILARVSATLGPNSGAMEALGRVYGAPPEQAALARATLSYLGAGAMAPHTVDRKAIAESVLACPVCHGDLSFGPDLIGCGGCAATFKWLDDVPELIPIGLAEPDQFPTRLVEIYEERYRPRFVQLMARDWPSAGSGSRGATFEQEEAYLQANFRPLNGQVLDLACGAGGWTRILAGIVGEARIVALDYSTAMVAACSERLPGALVVRGSASCLPIRDSVLGGANCSDALQALPDPRAALEEISRCLAPGAPLTCFTFRESPTPYRYFQRRFPIHPRRLFREEDLRGWCAETGLTVTDLRIHGDALFLTAHRD